MLSWHSPCGGAPVSSADGNSVSAAQESSRVESMDGHVEQQRVRHLVAKTPEMRAEVEVCVQHSQFAELALDQGAKCDKSGVVAAALANHVELSGALRGEHHLLR